MKPLCWEPLFVLISVVSYDWLSSVACAELCARQSPGACEKANALSTASALLDARCGI